MPQFVIRCRTERVLTVDADDEASARMIAEDTDFSAWDSTDSPYSIRQSAATTDPHLREVQCGAQTLRIDMPRFRAQRELLTKIADLARQKRPYEPASGDEGLLDGLLELTDALLDAAEEGVEELVEHARQVGAPEDALDELVHDTAQECRLGDLNELESPQEQEAHLGSVEKSASDVNNMGLDEQIRFLLAHGVSPERIREELESAE